MEDKVEVDYIIEIPLNRSFKILQITDTQIIDSSQRRYEDRLLGEEKTIWLPEYFDERLAFYLNGVVEKTKPDLIIHTGDFTYGEFDDNGKMLQKHIELMDSFNVPWCLALGNHERETHLGVKKYCKAIENSKNSIYKSEQYINGEKLEGNGSCSILITKNGKPLRLLFIMDSGCGTEEFPSGIKKNQKKWMEAIAHKYNVPSLLFLHIPLLCFNEAVEKFGYSYDKFKPFEIPIEKGFGYMGERVNNRLCIDQDGKLFEFLKDIDTDGIFAGHIHKNSYSVDYCGMRLTYGLKSSEYDSHIKSKLGGTLIEINGDNRKFNINHCYVTKS